MPVARAIHKVSNVLDRGCSGVLIAALAAMVLLTGAQIVCRLFFTALAWSEELSRYLLIWSTFLGAGCVYRHSGHIAVTVIQESLPKPVEKALRVAVHVICMLLFAVLLYYSARYCGKLNKTATALPIKMKYIYLCIPISMAIMLIHALTMALEELTQTGEKEVKA